MKEINNGLELVRKKPNLFLRNGIFLPEDISGRMVSQAFLLGAKNVEVINNDLWWGLISDFDWLTENPVFSDPSEPFMRIISDNRLGQNSCYGEILLAAFCSDVSAYKLGSELYRLGEDNIPKELKKHTESSFCIFFRYERPNQALEVESRC